MNTIINISIATSSLLVVCLSVFSLFVFLGCMFEFSSLLSFSVVRVSASFSSQEHLTLSASTGTSRSSLHSSTSSHQRRTFPWSTFTELLPPTRARIVVQPPPTYPPLVYPPLVYPLFYRRRFRSIDEQIALL